MFDKAKNATNDASALAAIGIYIPQLRATVSGQVLTEDDAGYNEARTVFYGGIDRKPAIIVRAANATDVSQVVLLARKTELELAIRSGGHSMAGHSVTDGGIVLDLSQMKKLDIDVKQRTTWAETGLTAGEYTKAVGDYGLATGFGDTGSVGIGGITLGGGVGFFVRKYGLTIDDLLAAEIVTADGQILHTDADTHPDLFWAIRGGGGNFGVATRFKFRLHEVGTVVGGMLILPANPDILRAFLAQAESAPEQLSTIASVMTAPPMPFLPAEIHGKLILMALLLYSGDVEAGQRIVASFRDLATPIVDTVKPVSYAEMFPDEPEGYHPLVVVRNFFMDAVDEHTAEGVFEYVQSSTAMMAAAQFRVLGGAMARVPVEATAFAHRTRRMMVNVAAIYQNPAETAQHEAWVTDFAAALKQGDTAAYVNFIGNEGAERVRDAYPVTTWERLTKIKAQYDPTNLFRLNQNIPPAITESYG